MGNDSATSVGLERLDCTHSTLPPKTVVPKQRVLISAQYEQKIDDIASGIQDIRQLLQNKDAAVDIARLKGVSIDDIGQSESPRPAPELQPVLKAEAAPIEWDASSHIVDFVKAVVKDCDLRCPNLELGQAVSSLSTFVQPTDGALPNQNLDCGLVQSCIPQARPSLPPLTAAVDLLRWAKEHKNYNVIAHLSHILPLERFTSICQKVYFAIDGYNELEFILANGYLSYLSFEYFAESGLEEYNEYCNLCWKNLVNAFARLPLILPASMETIAVLALGAFNAIENSKSSLAWTFISYASNLCQTLGYHRLTPTGEHKPDLRKSQERLFWLVYNLDKGLSLRFGRSSNIRDRDITLPFDPNALRRTRQARIQGQVYDELYSPEALSRPEDERGKIAESLARGLREIIQETCVDIMNAEQRDSQIDPTGIVYLRCGLICTSSTLALVLRAAAPSGRGPVNGASDECVAVAREVMQTHQRCMLSIRSWKYNTSILHKYINWAVLHTPFIPFSILFTQAVQRLDQSDLARVERFAESLKPETGTPASPKHPYRIYQLLSRTARLCVDSQIQVQDQVQNHDAQFTMPLGFTPASSATPLPSPLEAGFEFPPHDFGAAVEVALAGSSSAHPTMTTTTTDNEGVGGLSNLDMGDLSFQVDGGDGLSDWYYNNQQIMNLMDEDAVPWSF